jgi:hypothetical protein
VLAAGVDLRRRGRLMVGRCPFHSESTGSFTVYVENVPPSFHCFGCGAHGTAIDFWMKDRSVDLSRALSELGQLLHVSRDTPSSDEERARAKADADARRARLRAEADAREAASRQRRMMGAEDIWRAARHDVRLARYLDGRRVPTSEIARGWGAAAPGGVPLSLRLLMQCPDHENRREDPAMVGVITDRDGRFRGVHRTFLNAELSAKRNVKGLAAKMMLGVAWGGAVRLTPTAPRLFLAEGIETGLSVMAAMAMAGETAGAAVWAALSLDNIAGRGWDAIPDMEKPAILLPDGVVEAVICEDADNKDKHKADALYARAARRFGHRTGIRVRRARPQAGMDFNDMMRSAA